MNTKGLRISDIKDGKTITELQKKCILLEEDFVVILNF